MIKRKLTGLFVLLDLSAAFDTVDHNLLLSRLKAQYGIEGNVLKWYESYLSDREQTVVINGVQSQPEQLSCGVPQGSILGPELFTKYASPVAQIIRKYGLCYHVYADDTQIYVFFEMSNASTTIERVQECIGEVREWMRKNWLKFNDSKTEIILLGAKKVVNQLQDSTVQIGGSVIKSAPAARNIGVIFDSQMTMADHVAATCRAANFHIRNIGRIRKYLSRPATEALVHAFVTSKLDHCNSLLSGIPAYLLQRLQRVQNTAARVVTRGRKFDRITPVLKSLHWLPVRLRIQFKTMLLTYKALHGIAPSYIRELLVLHNPPRTLRSSNKFKLVVPITRLKSYGDRSFSKAAPSLWNSLPEEIKDSKSVDSFKNKLKTHLMKEAFNM